MQLFDTHCHIQDAPVIKDDDDATYKRWAKAGHPDPAAIIAEAGEHDVTRMMLVGCSLEDSERAVALAGSHDNLWASIGIHPHEAAVHLKKRDALEAFKALAGQAKVKAIGECGLDNFYEHSPKEAQKEMLHFQLQLAQQHGLPVIFHVREAFDDFWPIFDQYKVTGVLHSFTASQEVLQAALARNLYVGLNGILTFTKDPSQLSMAKEVPLEKMVLETDAPFLTPAPYRGTICLPKHVRVTATFLANLRGESLATLADSTTQNARLLFDV